MKYTLLLFCTLFLSNICFAQTANLSPSKYNTMYDGGQLANGAGSYIFAGQTSSFSNRRALLHFDLSSIPAGATINSVTLSMNMNRTNNTVPQNAPIHALTQDWGQGTSDAPGQEGAGTTASTGDATWTCNFYNGTSCSNTWSTPGGDFIATPLASTTITTLGTYTWTGPGLVAAAQTWLDVPANNFGIIVLGNETTSRTAKRFDVSTINLAVVYSIPSVASITSHPVDSSTCDGFNASFSITASNATSYQWQEFTTAWADLSNGGVYGGTNTDNLTITAATTSMNGYIYRCIAVGTSNSDTSNTATLSVGTTPNVIIFTPPTTTICTGDSIELTGSPGGTSQWFLNGNPISGATNNIYFATIGGTYTMSKTNMSGCTATSSAIVLNQGNTPTVFISASDTVICMGDTAILSTPPISGGSYQWFINGSPLINGVNNTYSAVTSGSYNVQVTDPSGCLGTAAMDQTILVSICGGIDDIQVLDAISVFPNPTKGQLNIQTKGQIIKSLELFDVQGRQVEQVLEVNQSSILWELDHLTRGIYFLRTVVNHEVLTTKIIVQ